MKLVRVGDYITEQTQRNKASEDIPVYSVTNTQGFCQDYFNKEVASKDKSTYKIVKKGWFAYNPSRINVGSIDWLKNNIAIVSPLYNVFSLSSEMDPDYLLYYLKSSVGLSLINATATGSVRNNLKFSMLANFYIPLPDLKMQKSIVSILKRIQSLIDTKRKQINLLDELVKARFVELFGDPIENPMEWPTRSLMSMGKCKNGMNFHNSDSGIEINCLGVGDFKDYSVIVDTSLLPTVSLNEMPSDDYLLQDEDIVFVRSNGNKKMVGRSIIAYPGNTPTTFSGFCIRFRNEDKTISVPYLLSVLKTDGMRKQMYGRGANIQNLNQQILASLQIPVPPLELQQQYVSFVAQIDKSKFVESLHLAKCKNRQYNKIGFLEVNTWDM